MLTVDGDTKPIREWSKLHGVPVETIRSRIDLFGWTERDAVVVPVDRRFSSGDAGRIPAKQARPVPRLKHHADGRAYCKWSVSGRVYFRTFGLHGSDEANEAYRRFCVDWVAGAVTLVDGGSATTVAVLVAEFLKHCATYYVKHGKRTSEYYSCRSAVSFLARCAGTKKTADLTTDDLRTILRLMEESLALNTCQAYHNRILMCLSWGVSHRGSSGQPLVPVIVLHNLREVPALESGRSRARQTEPVTSVAWAIVEQTLPHLGANRERQSILEVLVRVHWLTGMRSTEILSMRPRDLDRSRPEWCYTSPDKMQHRRGRSKTARRRNYWIGPQAIALISPLLANCPDDRPIFALPRLRGRGVVLLDKNAYGRIISKACKLAGVTPWHPHQIRHSRATEVERIYESDAAAAAAIGDSPNVTREVYIDPSDVVRRRIARETG